MRPSRSLHYPCEHTLDLYQPIWDNHKRSSLVNSKILLSPNVRWWACLYPKPFPRIFRRCCCSRTNLPFEREAQLNQRRDSQAISHSIRIRASSSLSHPSFLQSRLDLLHPSIRCLLLLHLRSWLAWLGPGRAPDLHPGSRYVRNGCSLLPQKPKSWEILKFDHVDIHGLVLQGEETREGVYQEGRWTWKTLVP